MSISNRNKFSRAALIPLHVALCGLLGGCALAPGPSTKPPAALTGSRMSGAVHGGQQPVSGATIQLYAAGNTGYGSSYAYTSGTSLLGSNVVTTDSNGNFTLTGDYTCPTPSTLVYIVATGGNPGLVGSAVNNNIGLMSALGPCGQLTPSTFTSINELTTVASIWALAPFMTGANKIGTSATNAQGLVNAFATVNKLVSINSGTSPGSTLPAGATAPLAKMNTLADVLAACVNSTGGEAGDQSTCGTLFSASTVNGTAPVDTITAAMNIAHNPTVQVAMLTNMATPASPFQPTLSSTPSDLSLVVSYTGGGISTPRGAAVDASGDVWVANAGGNSVIEMDNSGAALSGASGYSVGNPSSPSAIAIDQSGNAWVSNMGNSTVSKITALGASGNVYSGGGLSSPNSIAVDAYGNLWITNAATTSVTIINTSGTLTNFSASAISSPIGVALDPK